MAEKKVESHCACDFGVFATAQVYQERNAVDPMKMVTKWHLGTKTNQHGLDVFSVFSRPSPSAKQCLERGCGPE